MRLKTGNYNKVKLLILEIITSKTEVMYAANRTDRRIND